MSDFAMKCRFVTGANTALTGSESMGTQPSEAMLEARLNEACACLRAAMQYIEYHCRPTEEARAGDSRWQRWINASCLDDSNNAGRARPASHAPDCAIALNGRHACSCKQNKKVSDSPPLASDNQKTANGEFAAPLG